MKRLLVLACYSIIVHTMDASYEEKPHPENQKQSIIHNKNTTSEQFKEHVSKRPNLQELTISGHQMPSIPKLEISLTYLHKISLPNGQLRSTVQDILKIAPHLSVCDLSNNLITVWGNTDDNTDISPMYKNLTELNCSNNCITMVDFTQLRKKLPNLTQLNLSDCPITTFKTNNCQANSVVTTINLKNTLISDSEKKEIFKNARYAYVFDSNNEKQAALYFVLLTTIFVLAPVQLIINSIPSVSAEGIVAAVFLDIAMSMVLAGSITYFGFLGFTSPKNRFKTVYIPFMDKAEKDYPEEEISTRYSRIIKRFPYFPNIIKRYKSENLERLPLNRVEAV